MNATQFLELIQNADHLQQEDFLRLKQVQEDFPYFQIPHVLVARYNFLKNGKNENNFLAQAAIASPDRIWLKTLIEQPVREDAPAPNIEHNLSVQVPETALTPNSSAESLLNPKIQTDSQVPIPEDVESTKPTRRKRTVHKDDLIETIKRKEKKAILDAKKKEQIDLIKAFSKKDIKLATIKEIESNQNNENLAESSTTLHDSLLSESFAKILVSQGKKGMAKQIYEKLTLKFPEKRTYFADLIEKLKE